MDVNIVTNDIFPNWISHTKNTERALLFSPYICSPTANQLLSRLKNKNKKIDIYTLFNPEVFINHSSSIATLIELHKKGIKIHSLKNLHAKILILSPEFSSIGSQNITNKGRENLEASIIVTNKNENIILLEKLKPWIRKSKLLSLEDLERMKKLVDLFKKDYKKLILEATSKYLCNEKEIEIEQQNTLKIERNKEIEIENNRQLEINIKSEPETIEVIIISENINLLQAQNFIRSCIWWLTHVSGPVRARGFANRIMKTRDNLWGLKLGANTFLISQAILDSEKEILRFFNVANESQKTLENLQRILRGVLAGCVENNNGDRYSYYPISPNDELVFGAQAIDLKDAVAYLCRTYKVKDYL